MSMDPWAALERLTNEFSRHLTATEQREGAEDQAVADAYERVSEAYQDYEDALWDTHGESLPLEVYDDEDEED